MFIYFSSTFISKVNKYLLNGVKEMSHEKRRKRFKDELLGGSLFGLTVFDPGYLPNC